MYWLISNLWNLSDSQIFGSLLFKDVPPDCVLIRKIRLVGRLNVRVINAKNVLVKDFA